MPIQNRMRDTKDQSLANSNWKSAIALLHSSCSMRAPNSLLHVFFAGLVAFSEAIRPDPIPNSAVKRFRANGTMSQDLGE
jgi:hypothetical protein